MTHDIYPYMVREHSANSTYGWRCSCGAQHTNLWPSRAAALADGEAHAQQQPAQEGTPA